MNLSNCAGGDRQATCPTNGPITAWHAGVADEAECGQWMGIDVSIKAAGTHNKTHEKRAWLFYDGVHREDIPQRTDIEPLKKCNHPDNKRMLHGEHSGECNGCHTHFKLQNPTVDHIIPKSKGGTDHLENLQLLCSNCTRVKGDREQGYLIAKLAA